MRSVAADHALLFIPRALVLVDVGPEIAAKGAEYAALYDRLPSGDYVHKTFQFNHAEVFSVRGVVDEWMTQ